MPTRKVRKCQDFKEVCFPCGARCLVNALKSERDAGPECPGQGSQQGLQPATKSRADPKAKLLKLGKSKQVKKPNILKHFSVIGKKYCSECFF